MSDINTNSQNFITIPIFQSREDVINALNNAKSQEERKAIRTLGFGCLYGMSGNTLSKMAEAMQLTSEQTNDLYQKVKEKYDF